MPETLIDDATIEQVQNIPATLLSASLGPTLDTHPVEKAVEIAQEIIKKATKATISAVVSADAATLFAKEAVYAPDGNIFEALFEAATEETQQTLIQEHIAPRFTQLISANPTPIFQFITKMMDETQLQAMLVANAPAFAHIATISNDSAEIKIWLDLADDATKRALLIHNNFDAFELSDGVSYASYEIARLLLDAAPQDILQDMLTSRECYRLWEAVLFNSIEEIQLLFTKANHETSVYMLNTLLAQGETLKEHLVKRPDVWQMLSSQAQPVENLLDAPWPYPEQIPQNEPPQDEISRILLACLNAPTTDANRLRILSDTLSNLVARDETQTLITSLNALPNNYRQIILQTYGPKLIRVASTNQGNLEIVQALFGAASDETRQNNLLPEINSILSGATNNKRTAIVEYLLDEIVSHEDLQALLIENAKAFANAAHSCPKTIRAWLDRANDATRQTLLQYNGCSAFHYSNRSHFELTKLLLDAAPSNWLRQQMLSAHNCIRLRFIIRKLSRTELTDTQKTNYLNGLRLLFDAATTETLHALLNSLLMRRAIEATQITINTHPEVALELLFQARYIATDESLSERLLSLVNEENQADINTQVQAHYHNQRDAFRKIYTQARNLKGNAAILLENLASSAQVDAEHRTMVSIEFLRNNYKLLSHQIGPETASSILEQYVLKHNEQRILQAAIKHVFLSEVTFPEAASLTQQLALYPGNEIVPQEEAEPQKNQEASDSLQAPSQTSPSHALSFFSQAPAPENTTHTSEDESDEESDGYELSGLERKMER